MDRLQTRLVQTNTLWVLFLATLLMSLGFLWVMQHWQFGIIDEISDPAQLAAHLRAMTAQQKTVHAWMTGTLDVAYPLAYGSFFIGMALRYFGRFGPFLAVPGLLVIPVDLVEGVVQILLLSGAESVLSAKAWITPLKLGLFFLALAIAAFGLGLGTVRGVRARRAAS